MEVRFSPSALRKYKKNAGKVFPLEHLELVFGRITPHTAEIALCHPVPTVATETSVAVVPGFDLEKTCREIKEKHGYDYLGTIHSHPGADVYPFPTYDDHEVGTFMNEWIFGVDWIVKLPSGRLRHTITWWQPQRPLPALPLDKSGDEERRGMNKKSARRSVVRMQG